MTDLEFLPDHRAHKALELWRSGSDTLQIAIIMRVPEAEVFNTLRKLREEARETRAA